MVVTRFAPSPTGYLHVGGARTALFCWLFARHNKGRMILRIEDTDQKRNTPTAVKQVIADLSWLGIDWDEGPDVGGANGPYLQSERLDIYNEYINKLLEAGKAYYCFDTPEELAAMREEAVAQKRASIYKRPAEFPDAGDVKKARAEGKPVTVRFAMQQEGEIIVEDMVRGQVKFEASEIGDFIIQKSDGYPTYHFACVVDDELMEVTHVIRGQEHLMNTPGHQGLQDALGFGRPEYAHMSVTISEGGGKLSKRERGETLRKTIGSMGNVDFEALAAAAGIGADEVKGFVAGKSVPDIPCIDAMAGYLGVDLPEINVVDFFRSGYLPEAMVNFLALLGWSPEDGREIMSVQQLIECFDIGRLTKSNSLFDRKKLVSFNTEHIRMAPVGVVLGHFKAYLEAVGSSVGAGSDELLERLIKANDGARTLAQIEKKCRFLFVENENVEYDEKAVKKVLLKHEGLSILRIIGEKLGGLEAITSENIEKMLRDMAEERGVGLGKVAQPLRVAICGTTVSPPIFDSVDMLGKKNTLERIEITLKKFATENQSVEN